MAPDLLPYTEDAEANRLLASNPLALLIGMLLDQQIPMERAFGGPRVLEQRLGSLDATRIAGLSEDELMEAFRGPPAIHRFPASMATRTQALCRHLLEFYEGSAAALWETASDGEELFTRLSDLPGFGEAKARIFIKVIGLRLGAAPEGWERHAAGWPSIADVESFDDVGALRAKKRAMKRKEH